MPSERLIIPVTTPFRLDFTAWALRRRQSNIVDRWAGNEYIRVLVDGDRAVEVTVAQLAWDVAPQLAVTLRSDHKLTEGFPAHVQLLLQQMLGLAADLRPFYSLARSSDILRGLVEQFLGVRPPRFPTMFEALVNSIACQQVSLDSGIAALNRLSERFGVRLGSSGTVSCAFPRPMDLRDAPDPSILELGFSRQKTRAIKELSQDASSDYLDLGGLERMTNDHAVRYLSNLQGIGRWSAEYALLRGLGRLDMFPGDDVGAQNNLQRLFHLDAKPGYDEIKDLVAEWNPYQGLVYFHLLLEKLELKGLV
jgi:DNA-3-methyladenine glycosylase II